MSTETSSTPGSVCPQHPDASADYVCVHCQTAVCGDCCYALPEGGYSCKTCYHAEPAPENPPAPSPPPLPALMPPPLRLAVHQPVERPVARAVTPQPGRGCVQHAHVMPVAQCYNCGANVCRTCDFVFPGNLHFCPVCVTSATGKLSPRRKKYLITAFILAGWATLGMVLFFAGAVAGVIGDGPGAEMAAGMFLLLLVGLPSIIGTALGMSARRPGGPNPVSIWIALIWSALVMGGMMAMIVVGNLMK